MYKTGFVTELQGDASPGRHEAESSLVMKSLASDLSAVRLRAKTTSAPHDLPSGLVSKWNSLATERTRKEALLASLESTLRELDRASAPLDLESEFQSAEAEREEVRAALTQCELEARQYQHVLRRLHKDIVVKKNRAKELQDEFESLCHLHQGMAQELESIESQHALSVRELSLASEHFQAMQDSFKSSRKQLTLRLSEEHTELQEELTVAKEEKAKQLAVRKNISRLTSWLQRQRDARKVLRLHIGLEELGTRRLDRVISTVIGGLEASSMDDALRKYTETMAKNHSLVQEAEYKLQQQAIYEIKLSTLVSELQILKRDIERYRPLSLQIRSAKTDIYHMQEMSKVNLAKLGLEEVAHRRTMRQFQVMRVLSLLQCLFDLVRKLDPYEMSSASVEDLSTQSDTVGAFLLLEKKVQFLRDVAEQRNAIFQSLKPGKVVETMKALYLRSTARRLSGEQARKISEIYSTHFTSAGTHDEHARVKNRAHTLIRSVAAVEHYITKSARFHPASQRNSDEGATTHGQMYTTNMDLPLIVKTEETPRTVKKAPSSQRQLRKELEEMKKAAKRITRTSQTGRLSDFMFELRDSEKKVMRMTSSQRHLLSLPAQPLLRISNRSMGSTRAETGVSARSVKGYKSSSRLH